MSYLSVRVLRLDHVFPAKWDQIQSKTNRRAVEHISTIINS